MARKIASLQINAAEAANDQLLIARSNNLIFDSVANILVAGNAIEIEANGRISSTAAGGGNVTISTTPPTDKKAGDIWISDESGIQFTWVADADSSQWVEFGTVGLQPFANLGALESVNSNVSPSVTETYDLGSSDKKWKDLYLSGNTIYLGNTTISASDNDLVLPANTKVGNTNTSLPAGGAFMFRNKLINGNFDIWQRGTSQTSTGYGSADRWILGVINTSDTMSQQAFTLGQTDVPNNPKYFMRHEVTSSAGAGNYALVNQRIEGVETLSGKTLTLSFWAKADASKNIAVEFIQNFGTGGSPSTQVNEIGAQLVALTTSWTKYTVSVSIPSVSGKTLGTDGNDWLGFIFWFDAGSNFDARAASLGQQSGTFDIAQVQIEEGTAATPFEMRFYGIEMSLCQRYYLHQMAANATGYATASGQTARCGTQVNFPVAMRSSDWSTSYILGQSGTVNNTPNFSVQTIYGTSIYWTATGGTSTWWSGRISFDAEL